MDELLPQVVLNRTFGAALLGSYAAVMLWGVTCLQTVFYYIHYRQDKRILKLLVMWLWIMDTAHQALTMKGVYTLVVTDFGDLQSLNGVVPELLFQVAFTSLTAFPVHLFFIYRIWRFSGKKWIFVVTLVPATVYCTVSGIVYVGLGFGKSRIQVASGILRTLATSANLVAAALDVTIVVGMVCVLLDRTDLAVHHNSKQLLSRLLFFSINTGVWTAAFAVVSAITFSVYRDDLIYISFYLPLCPMYCNTLLANLNVRGLLRRSTDGLRAHEMGFPSSWILSTPAGNVEFAAAPGLAGGETPGETPASVQ